MFEILINPYHWFAAAAVVFGMNGALIYLFCCSEFRRHGYEPEPEPKIDFDLLELELDAEFGRLVR